MRASLAPDGDFALGPAQVLHLMVLHVGDLLHLDIQVLAKGLVLDLVMVHHGQGLLGGEPLHQVEVALHLLLAGLLAPVGVAVHAVAVPLPEAVFGAPRRRLRLCLGRRFLRLPALAPLLLLGFNRLLLCGRVCLHLLVLHLFGFSFSLGLILPVVLIIRLALAIKILIERSLHLLGSTKVRQGLPRHWLLLGHAAEGSHVSVVPHPALAPLEDEARPRARELGRGLEVLQGLPILRDFAGQLAHGLHERGMEVLVLFLFCLSRLRGRTAAAPLLL
mmetsp:Transcript_67378/g.160727  ORF Transcript_67378/g.160727 Transcript_67378/m.160727 type:complete len:276 (+) Transcript_67378:356-1183(+)